MNSKISHKIKELLHFAKENNLFEISWQEKGMKVGFKRSTYEVPTKKLPENAEVLPQEIPTDYIPSPIVGTFRRAKSKGRPPMVVKGNHIKPGDRLAVVECMKIPTDVVSFCSGEVRDILVQDGDAVEYGQPLFQIQTNGNQ